MRFGTAKLEEFSFFHLLNKYIQSVTNGCAKIFRMKIKKVLIIAKRFIPKKLYIEAIQMNYYNRGKFTVDDECVTL